MKPLTNKLYWVDVAAINGRISVLPGEILKVRFGEVSRGHSNPGNEPMNEAEVSRKGEGLNVRLFKIRSGGSNVIVCQPDLKLGPRESG